MWMVDVSHPVPLLLLLLLLLLQLATRHTPMHPWKLPGLPQGFRVSIKRDDMTGSVLGGNKVHKMCCCVANLPPLHPSVLTRFVSWSFC